jgi:hypothetical protein
MNATPYSSSANFYRFASACAAFYLVAQITQEITFHYGINDSASGEQAILERLMPLDRFRLTMILLSFFPILVAFGALALRRAKMRPAASLLGFTFSFLFVIGEVINRAIDLFVISLGWAVEYQAAASLTIKLSLAERIQVWEQTFTGFYFVLRVGLFLGSLCFAIAAWDTRQRWNQFVAIAFAANAVRIGGRLAEGYMGRAQLAPVNKAIYFPATLLIYGTLAVWLWKQAGEVEREILDVSSRLR